MILFFDTETTGLPKNWKAPVTDLDNWPRLVQLAYLVYDFDGNLIHSCNEIIKPDGFTIPTEASNVHGITTEMASQRGTDINDVFELFLIHLKRSKMIVAHNMAFDEKIIGSELIRLGKENVIVAKEKVCTMLKTVDLCKIEGPYGYKWPKLEELHRYLFNHDFEGAHDALADIQATAKCFWELVSMGQIYLNERQHEIELKIYTNEDREAEITIPQNNNIVHNNDLSFDNTKKILEKYNYYFSDTEVLKSTFFTDFLFYPFLRPPHSLWFDGSINVKENEFYIGPENIEELLNSFVTKGIKISERDIKSGDVKNYSSAFSANYIISILEIHFPTMIFTGIGEIYSEKNYYKSFYNLPNILIYDKKTNIHIAINIDSPYNMETRKIEKSISYFQEIEENHNQGENKSLDYNRNINLMFQESYDNPNHNIYINDQRFIVEDGPPNDIIFGPFKNYSSWFFIKLSEKQVILQPHECCRFINEEIYKLLKIKLSNSDFSNIPQLNKEPMWTRDVAEKMLKDEYREMLHQLIPNRMHNDKKFFTYNDHHNEWRKKNDPYWGDDRPF
jgi:DNA polymerase III epsilon subunit-like protein